MKRYCFSVSFCFLFSVSQAQQTFRHNDPQARFELARELMQKEQYVLAYPILKEPQQNYKNHRRIVPSFHILTGLALLALIIGAIRNLMHTSEDNQYEASLLVLVSFILFSLYAHSRLFALKAQDRAIRAEESLRHFQLTGKPLHPSLTLSQIIALRFASDEEFPALAEKAAAQSLSNKSIKESIQAWRPDTHRV